MEDITFSYHSKKKRLPKRSPLKRILIHGGLFLLLTVLSQIGGFIWLMVAAMWYTIPPYKRRWIILGQIVHFLVFYIIISWVIVPTLSDRVPLPRKSNAQVAPYNQWTILLNRHYVNQKAYDALMASAEELQKTYPKTKILYLDANFPLWDGFPMLPHVSHNDGNRVDIAFYYSPKEGKYMNAQGPSSIGYGVMEDPKPGEFNQVEACDRALYGYTDLLFPDWWRSNYTFDEARTKTMIQALMGQKQVSKFFLEKHLQNRFNLQDSRFRFQGCKSVRHDDHIHVEFE